MTHNGGYAAPGWYPDAGGTQHYWDGSQWRGTQPIGDPGTTEGGSGGVPTRSKRRLVLPGLVAVVVFVLGIGVGAAAGSPDSDADVAALIEERDQALAELEDVRAAANTSSDQPADDGGGEEADDEGEADPAVDGESAEPAPDHEVIEGSREAPFAIGEPVGNDAWDVTLGEPHEAGAEVADENQFNEPAPEGMEYWIVPVTATYTGDETGLPGLDLTVAFVGSDGRTYSDSCGVIPDDLTDVDELYADATAEGNTCVAVPEGADGLWTLAAGWSDPVFFTTSN